MSLFHECPRWLSKRVLTKHTGRKIGAGIGAVAGFGSAISSAATGASFAIQNLSDKTPYPQTLLKAIVGGLVGGVAGCAAGAAFGDALDQTVFDNYECLDCGYSL